MLSRLLALACLAAIVPLSAAQSEAPTPATMDGRIRPSSIQDVQEAYIPPIFPSSHGANLLLLKNGDLLCFFFSGTQEGASDVAIVVSRLPRSGKSWSTPTVVDHHIGESYQNPVGFQAPDGTVWLWHTAQAANQGQANAKVLVTKSVDNGRTWQTPKVAFDAPGAFLRDPLLIMPNGAWMLPMYYTPTKGITSGASSHHSAIKISSDKGKTWKSCPVPESNGYVQPSVVRDGSSGYIAFFRSRFADHIFRSTSKDGCTWSAPVATDLPNNNSSIQAIRLHDGKILLAFNDVAAAVQNDKPKTGPRKPLTVALSSDGGLTWGHLKDIERGRDGVAGLHGAPVREEYSYPAVAQTANGRIFVAYTFLRETIKVVSFNESWLEN